MTPLARAFAAFVMRLICETWSIFFSFALGGLMTALTFRLDLCEVIPQILSDAVIIFVGGFVGALAWCLGIVARHLYRNRGFDSITLTKRVVGGETYRADLHVPREWRRLDDFDFVGRVEAQLKGQGPF